MSVFIAIFSILNTICCKFGKTFHLWIFNRLYLFVHDVSNLERILSSPHFITKNFFYDMMRPWLGDGLLLSTGSKWHNRRKILTPTYHFKILEQFIPVFDEQSSILVQRLAHRADAVTSFDIFPEICVTALDTIAETAMGVKINAHQNSNVPYVKALARSESFLEYSTNLWYFHRKNLEFFFSLFRVAHIIGTRITNPFLHFEWIFRSIYFPMYFDLKKNVRIMHDFTDKIIRERRNVLNRTTTNQLGKWIYTFQ